jgi:hypothetical protein
VRGGTVLLVGLACSRTGHPAVARFVADGHGDEQAWRLVGVSRQRPGTSIPAADTWSAAGAFYPDHDYAGCPSCGATGFVRCGGCANLACWNTESPLFRCPTCGRAGRVEGEIDSVSSLGGA